MQNLLSSIMIFTDFAVNNLTDKDLKNWLEIINKGETETEMPLEFLRQKIPNFDKLFFEEFKKKIC